MSADKIIEGLREAVDGKIARMTVFLSLGKHRVTFDGEGEVIAVDRLVRRATAGRHSFWRTVPKGPQRERLIIDAWEKERLPPPGGGR